MIKTIVVQDTNKEKYPDASYEYNNEPIPLLGDSIVVYEVVKKGKVESKVNPAVHVIRHIIYDFAEQKIILQTRAQNGY